MPELKLYNTLSREKEVFKPIDDQNVRMYCCGPTVYNYAHIGNGRAAVVFDLLNRLLRHVYGEDKVKYVRNITDVDDKIMEAARKSGESIDSITRHYEKIYNEDMAGLGCRMPDVQPRCTEHIPQMVSMIEKLVAKGHAYQPPGNEHSGHVLFNVPSMPAYGQLSRKNRDELIAGARVDVAPYKKDPADFVLWKPSAADQPGWPSPWGRGRPGWHIECSAMAEEHLGETFDIHAGGLDLIFPHHENEIAQSRCAHGGKPMARYWLHNGFLNMGDEKMSKSLGNVAYVHDLLKKWPGEVLRLALLSAHYRQPLNFTEDLLEQQRKRLHSWYVAINPANRTLAKLKDIKKPDDPYKEFEEALLEDLNTPLAISCIDRMKKIVWANEGEWATEAQQLMKKMGNMLGLLNMSEADVAKLNDGPDFAAALFVDSEEIQSMVDARTAAKKAKDFAESDRLRDELIAMGIELKDTPQGTEWRYKG